MENLLEQVDRARRKLNRNAFATHLGWWAFAALMLATLAVAAPKVVALEGLPAYWAQAWLLGALPVALIGAGITTYLYRRNRMEAAVEIDRRFQLRERVASSLSLPESEHESEIGLALINDAARSVERIDVSQEFPLRVGRPAWLPFVPAVIAFVLIAFVADRKPAEATPSATPAAQAEQVKQSTEQLRKKIEKKLKEAEEKENLKDAADALREVKRGVDDLEKKKGADRKEATVKLNDLANKLAERKKELGGSQALKEELNKLNNLGKGPAEKAVDALKQGNFGKALKEIEKMAKKLSEGKMSAEDKQKLADQLGKMKEKIEKAAEAQKQAMEDMKKQIEEQQRKGNQAEANKLQQKLNQMQEQQQAMERMKGLANKMGQAQQAMEKGDSQAAAEAMQQMANELQQMQQEIDEMEMLSDAMDEIEMAKQAMGCEDCQGGGCQSCQGDGQGPGNGNGDQEGDWGMGKGRGKGPRPDEKNDTNLRDSRVRQRPGPGSATFGGYVDGPNKKGDVRQSLKDSLEAGEAREAEALDEQNMPRSRQEHAGEYFRKLREGV